MRQKNVFSAFLSALIFLSVFSNVFSKIQERHLLGEADRKKDTATKEFIKGLDECSKESKGTSDISNNISNRCVKDFQPLLESLSPETSSKIVAIFKANTLTNKCCKPSQITDDIVEPMSLRLNAFRDTMTGQSSQNKAGYACLKNNEAVNVRIGIDSENDEKKENTDFIKENMKSSNELNQGLSKCIKTLNKIFVKNLGFMCMPFTALDKIFKKENGKYTILKRSRKDEEIIAESCGDYSHKINDHGLTLLTGVVDSFNYLAGLEECSYHSNFFNFDPKSDIDDPLFPDEVTYLI